MLEQRRRPLGRAAAVFAGGGGGRAKRLTRERAASPAVPSTPKTRHSRAAAEKSSRSLSDSAVFEYFTHEKVPVDEEGHLTSWTLQLIDHAAYQ